MISASNGDIRATVVNPGEWFGKTWLLLIARGLEPDTYVVEADTVEDAINVFSDSRYGHLIHVPDSMLDDYPEENRQYDGNGRVIETDWVAVIGRHDAELPWPCWYFGEGLPGSGLDPRIYEDYQVWLAENPHNKLRDRENKAGVAQLRSIQ